MHTYSCHFGLSLSHSLFKLSSSLHYNVKLQLHSSIAHVTLHTCTCTLDRQLLACSAVVPSCSVLAERDTDTSISCIAASSIAVSRQICYSALKYRHRFTRSICSSKSSLQQTITLQLTWAVRQKTSTNPNSIHRLRKD